MITDAQLSYAFSDNMFEGLQILFQVNNLTNEPYIAYSENKQRVLDYQEYGTSVSMDRVVIFGGQKQSVSTLCDMYSWDGVDWKLITATNQGPCVHSASMAWDTRSATSPLLIVANGYVDVNDTQNTDVWYFKFSSTTSGTWALASPPPCVPRRDAMGAFDRSSKKMVFFGGGDSAANSFNDTLVCPQ